MSETSSASTLSVANSAPAAEKTGIARLFSARGHEQAARRVANAMATTLIAGLIFVAIGGWPHWIPALLWAGACSAVGWVVGFLFGIPRTLSANTTANSPDSAAPRSGTNTNLEQISDWLTKIIVGVTLVQIGPALANLDLAAKLIAESLGGPALKSFAYALMMYFAITGFLGSYLLTRLFLQPAFDDESGNQ